ncbi:glycosyltransferase family 4 protein [Gemmiger formicilis]
MNKDVYHYGIGGRLAREVEEKPKWKKYVSSFKGNWMESIELADQLQKLGVKNAIYLPNFKKLRLMKETELRKEYDEPYKFCTFSRVMKEKGIEDAIDAVREINDEYQREVVSLDIYGPAEEAYMVHLNELLSQNATCRYCGVIPANESVEALKDYYALLFPTHWKHEGIPGTIIDALSAGVPVIARRWQYCDEMLKDGYTGLIYDFEQPEQLKTKIIYAINHKSDMMVMKRNCLKKAESYSEEHVIKQIIKEMGVE